MFYNELCREFKGNKPSGGIIPSITSDCKFVQQRISLENFNLISQFCVASEKKQEAKVAHKKGDSLPKQTFSLLSAAGNIQEVIK